MTHQIKHLTATGANQLYRLDGAPDRDMAAIFVAALFGGQVLEVEAIAPNAPRQHGEHHLGTFSY